MNNQYHIEALWWSWLILSEKPLEFSSARARLATQLLQYGVIP
jgi:hypothetical protein